MRDERTSVANCFLPILTILPYGGLLLPEECEPMFSRGFLFISYFLRLERYL